MNRLSEKEKLKAVYPKSKKWAAKVDDMSDAQLFAILRRIEESKRSK